MTLRRFNEQLRRGERHLYFDVNALITTICHSVNRPVADFSSHTKFAKCVFNRVLKATFKRWRTVPCTHTIPQLSSCPLRKSLARCQHTAYYTSTAYQYLKSLAIRQNARTRPELHTYCLRGRGDTVRQALVHLGGEGPSEDNETSCGIRDTFLMIRFPASESLYFDKDFAASEPGIPASSPQPDEDPIVMGPTAQYEW